MRIERAGEYEVTVRAREPFDKYRGSVEYARQSFDFRGGVLGGGGTPTDKAKTVRVELEAGDAKVSATIGANGKDRGSADYVELKYLGPAKK